MPAAVPLSEGQGPVTGCAQLPPWEKTASLGTHFHRQSLWERMCPSASWSKPELGPSGREPAAGPPAVLPGGGGGESPPEPYAVVLVPWPRADGAPVASSWIKCSGWRPAARPGAERAEAPYWGQTQEPWGSHSASHHPDTQTLQFGGSQVPTNRLPVVDGVAREDGAEGGVGCC